MPRGKEGLGQKESGVESRTGAVTVASRWVCDLAFAGVPSVRFGLILFPVRRVGQWREPGFE